MEPNCYASCRAKILGSIIKLSAKKAKLKESKTQEEKPEIEDDSQVYYEIVPKDNNRGNSNSNSG
jgi:hypothetical protein